ncbi:MULTISPECIES: hypothetical protein [Thermotoga]|jgi:hypothetical protein|uniref:Uncharacterized protein n=1 Tax=Thermotoga neapolitana (strain ATCC 49049 / DSM 4359 / NBRC 107923 / NS-E) TaxID=309803 RepID=B9K785_THENN|nr:MULTISPECIES: hypothetical protein [Thermotoga]MDK2786329.1 hypothetical protein [Thermotoga sp.]HBF10547.1 hypothetical protein [Thermotoga neapolitana]ACM22818.1 Putative uncharacterized protein [Thermotoga neapolitana DSM 4359]AJG40755.1 hypothetical protein TRQ7_04710 [Thermotoga sp. RQ7]KFZ22072.1 hypothetical protein LA10_03283 [Thermotoga neapolitana LA10]
MNILMFILTLISGILYLKSDILFGVFLGVVSMVFLYGTFETSREKYRAHLFVGSLIVLFFAGVSLLEYLTGFLRPLLGEEKITLTPGNYVLFLTGAMALFTVMRGKVKSR